jgi:hypothetical protein
VQRKLGSSTLISSRCLVRAFTMYSNPQDRGPDLLRVGTQEKVMSCVIGVVNVCGVDSSGVGARRLHRRT